MPNVILVTGSEGLIGTALRRQLHIEGIPTRRFDLQHQGCDVLKREMLVEAAKGCAGIVHLAAVSRVVWGERDPELCWRTNVEGTQNVLWAAQQSASRPWVIFASSREVYGTADRLPAQEDMPLHPCNVYGRSKAAGEQLCLAARADGVRTAILRLSNVYGRTQDHQDRVVPCFARQAALGEVMRIEGSDNLFDFTHVDDTTAGIVALIQMLFADAASPPPIHLLTGRPTSLRQLAEHACRAGGGRSTFQEAPSRAFDVTRFYGDPRRAYEILRWRPQIRIEEGVARLVHAFRAQLGQRADADAPRQQEGAR
jgi:nucleoside-diphosphate-sugar epimerase